ncbi:hypothetical protein AB0C32_37315, partial [Streptosporangium sp. NPDC048865]
MPRAAALALLLVSLTACSAEDWSRAGLPEGITKQSEAVQNLWNGSWIAALATGVVVWGLILWSVAFHRRGASPGRTQGGHPRPVYRGRRARYTRAGGRL